MYKTSERMNTPTNFEGTGEAMNSAASVTAQALQGLTNAAWNVTSAVAKKQEIETKEYNKELLMNEKAKGMNGVSAEQLIADTTNLEGSDAVLKAHEEGQRLGIAANAQRMLKEKLVELSTDPEVTPQMFLQKSEEARNSIITEMGGDDLAIASFNDFASQTINSDYDTKTTASYKAAVDVRNRNAIELLTNHSDAALRRSRSGKAINLKEEQTKHTQMLDKLVESGAISNSQYLQLKQEFKLNLTGERLNASVDQITNRYDSVQTPEEFNTLVSETEGLTESYRKQLTDSKEYSPEEVDVLVSRMEQKINAVQRTTEDRFEVKDSTTKAQVKLLERKQLLEVHKKSRQPLDLSDATQNQAAEIGLYEVVMGDSAGAGFEGITKDSDISGLVDDPTFNATLIQKMSTPEGFNQVMTYSRNIGVIPKQVTRLFSNVVGSSDQNLIAARAQYFSSLDKAVPALVDSSFSEKDRVYFTQFNKLTGIGMTPAEAMTQVNANLNRTKERDAEFNTELGSKSIESSRNDGAKSLYKEMGDEFFTSDYDSVSNKDYKSDYTAAYNQAYKYSNGDTEIAEQEANRYIKRVYGRTKLNTDNDGDEEHTAMRLAPEHVLPKKNGSHDWVSQKYNTDIAEYRKDYPDGKFTIKARKTATVKKPSYEIWVYDPDYGSRIVNKNYTF